MLAGLSVLLFVRRPPAPLWPVAFLAQVAALTWVVGDLVTYFADDPFETQLSLSLLFTGSLWLPSLWWQPSDTFERRTHWVESQSNGKKRRLRGKMPTTKASEPTWNASGSSLAKPKSRIFAWP